MQNNLAEKEELEVVEVDEEQAEGAVEQSDEDQAPAEDEAKSEDELEQYSESVQRRISKLTNRFREEERQRQAAIEYAEAVKQQNDELRSRLDKLDQSYVGEFGSRVEADAVAAKESYRKAYEDGDADGMFEAQQSISRIALEQARYEEAKRRNEERLAQPVEESNPTPQQVPQQQAAPDPKAEAWAGKNEWFGSDQTMTYAAVGIHRQLIKDEGFDTTSDED